MKGIEATGPLYATSRRTQQAGEFYTGSSVNNYPAAKPDKYPAPAALLEANRPRPKNLNYCAAAQDQPMLANYRNNYCHAKHEDNRKPNPLLNCQQHAQPLEKRPMTLIIESDTNGRIAWTVRRRATTRSLAGKVLHVPIRHRQQQAAACPSRAHALTLAA